MYSEFLPYNWCVSRIERSLGHWRNMSELFSIGHLAIFSLGVVGAREDRNYMRSSLSQWELGLART